MNAKDAFLNLYGMGWTLSRPFLHRNKRLKDGWESRLVPENWAPQCDIWLHSASGGEAYLVEEILKRSSAFFGSNTKERPCHILATTWTRQGMDVLHKAEVRLSETRKDIQVHTAFFPLDSPSLMRRAIEMVRPKAVVLFETELWLGLLSACKATHTPVLIINGRMTEKTLRGCQKLARLIPSFWKDIAPLHIGAITEADAHRFSQLFDMLSVHIVPNIKFDRCQSSITPNTLEIAPLLPQSTPIFLFASTREEEESLLVPAIIQLYEQNPSAQIIVAPRHLQRAEAWLQALEGKKAQAVLRSTLTQQAPAQKNQIIIWDTFGELSALYSLAQKVFVGGSLVPLGGQNMLEPLACGRIPYVGQYTSNFTWAMDGKNGLIASQLVNVCSGASELVHSMQADNADNPDEVCTRFEQWLKPHQGGTQASLDLITPFLHS